MFLVTGGADSSWELLASTEVYRPFAGEWREVPGGALPRPMAACGDSQQQSPSLWWEAHFELLTLLSLIACTFEGGQDADENTHAEILEYSDSEGEEKLTSVGEMSKKRARHAVSIIDFDNFKDYCQ